LFSSSPLAALIRLLLPLSTLPSPENSNKKPTHTHTQQQRASSSYSSSSLLPQLSSFTKPTNNPTQQQQERKRPKNKKNFQKPQMGRFQRFLSKASEEEWKKPGSLSHTERETNNRSPCFTQPKKQKKLPGYYRIKHTEPAENRKKGKRERGSNPPTTKSSSSP
jgi:hypothetical protein